MLGHGERKKKVSVPRVIVAVISGISLAVVMALGLGWLVMYLWNETLAGIFHLSPITYWQAVGLFILAKLFFSIGGHHGNQHDHVHKKVDARWHRWLGVEEDENQDKPEDAASFREFWQAEGKRAYAEYIERKKENQNQV